MKISALRKCTLLFFVMMLILWGCSGENEKLEDKNRIARLNLKCLLNESDCDEFGIALYRGLGVKVDKFKAFEAFKKSCEVGNRFGCYYLGFMYHNGEGVRQNKNLAEEFLGKSCELKLEKGCEAFATLKRCEENSLFCVKLFMMNLANHPLF